jgi:hypothetical protein
MSKTAAFHWRSMRFLALCAFAVLFLLLAPFLVEHRLLALAANLLYLNALLVAVSVAPRGRRFLRGFLLSAWLLAVASQLGVAASPTAAAPLSLAAGITNSALLVACVAATLSYVLTSREVSLDTIFAAIVAYLLLTTAFARVYLVVEGLAPGSFRLSGTPEIDLIYYSFVTIATLGYGDIVPLQPYAQMLASLQAVVGQFYIAVVVAWLVSNYTRRPTVEPPSPR